MSDAKEPMYKLQAQQQAYVVERVFWVMAALENITREQICSLRRGNERVCAARHVVVAVLYDRGMGLQDIAKVVPRHHATLLNSIHKVMHLPELRAFYQEVVQELDLYPPVKPLGNDLRSSLRLALEHEPYKDQITDYILVCVAGQSTTQAPSYRTAGLIALCNNEPLLQELQQTLTFYLGPGKAGLVLAHAKKIRYAA